MITENKSEHQVAETLTPKQIREMLGIDNEKIQQICKEADIKLKRNARGLTYFTKDDARVLKRFCSNPLTNLPATSNYRDKYNNCTTVQNTSIAQLLTSLKTLEETLCDKVTSVLDEKLEGMDDVVLELVRVKTENEALKGKINDMEKENYSLKKELRTFVRTTFGFYKKVNNKKNYMIK